MSGLKDGINSVSKTLADGTKVTYYYAWKGGPRLSGKPGSREFNQVLAEALARRNAPRPLAQQQRSNESTIESVVDKYLDSQDFLTCKERTRFDYRRQADVIVKKFGKLGVSALIDDADEMRGIFLDYRDELAKASPRQADYFMQVLNTILNWGKVRGKLKLNPLRDAGVKKLYNVTRADKIWSNAQIDEFMSRASPEITLAMTLALWTGQRQGDLLRLPWSAYDGETIKLSQAKSEGKRQPVNVVIHVAAPLKKALDSAARKSPIILVNQDGRPWTADGFRTMWFKTCARAKIPSSRKGGPTFHDLRGTTVVWLARAGATDTEIANVTGHSTKQVQSILAKHYLGRDAEVGRNAIVKLEAYAAARRQVGEPKRAKSD